MGIRKIVINRCFGGFGFSGEAVRWLAERGDVKAQEVVSKEIASSDTPFQEGWDECGIHLNDAWSDDVNRHDCRELPLRVAVVEALGEKASGEYALLRVIEIPDDVIWEIKEYDGNEHIAEVHRTWE
tara:strand:- start:150 stop:530 length:381 start_codon:yes stop_codon:yes gene_type:complete